MKRIKLYSAVVIFLLTTFTGMSQDNLFISAMKYEIQRGMDSLRIEKMLPPRFISYSISDANTLQVSATLGAIIKSESRPFRLFENRVLVGENGKTNENYVDENMLWKWSSISNAVPFSSDPDDIRRALWLLTDNNYKDAITNYEAKMSALNQQSLAEEEKQLIDFSDAPKSELVVPYKAFQIDKTAMENLARNLSMIFKKYPLIQKSTVNIYIYDSRISFANSEGSAVQYPLQAGLVQVVATTQRPGGEVLNDHVIIAFKDPSRIPEEKLMISEIEKMATNLSDLTKAEQVSEPYSGPVLFEGQAAAEVFVQKFFTNVNGLIALRKPVVGSEIILNYAPDAVQENTLEAMMNKKVISRDISIVAFPKLNSFGNIDLVGSFTIDAEGVKVPDTLVLVENGVLKNLLCSRVPTLKMKESNGHARAAMDNGGIKTVTGPGVIKMTNNNPLTTFDRAKLKEKFLAAAREEDLEYAYIVRKVVSNASGITGESGIYYGGPKPKVDLSKTIQVYRVKVSDGSEELVSLAEIQGLSVKSFKRLLGTSSELQVYNTIVKPVSGELNSWNFGMTGVPASFILPDGLLFEELDVVREKQNMVKNIPVAANPVNLP